MAENEVLSSGNAVREKKQVNFYNLPDELIVNIFSHLSPEDLVCKVARVCTLWRNIAKDLKLWKRCYLTYYGSDATTFKQVIGFAPAIGKLKIHMIEPLRRDVYNSVLQGCSKVQVFSLHCDGPFKEKLDVILHFKDTLEELSFYLDDAHLFKESSNVWCLKYIFKVLSSVNNLRFLKLYGLLSLNSFDDQLFNHGWKALESLDISYLTIQNAVQSNVVSSQQHFVLNILDCKAQSLKNLALPVMAVDYTSIGIFCDKIISSPIESLKGCEFSLPAVKNLHHIKSLHVLGLSQRSLHAWRESCSSSFQYQSTYRWITCVPQFSKLKELLLENIFDDERSLTQTLISACSSLESLTIFGGNIAGFQLAGMVKSLPMLKRLSLHQIHMLNSTLLRVIPVCLPNLEYLDLCHNELVGGTLQYYRDEVQTRMPNLRLLSDWGTWDRKGGKPYKRLSNLRPFKAVKCEVPSTASETLDMTALSSTNVDQVLLSKILDDFSDYEEDSDGW